MTIFSPASNLLLKPRIDSLINSVCGTIVGGELKQLGCLFSPPFLSKLSNLLYGQAISDNPGSVIAVTNRICWIDKTPLAGLTSKTPFANKVELGDAAFVFRENHFLNGMLQAEREKAFLLQAKVTSNLVKPPVVPVTTYDAIKKNSTYKELELYTNWPNFDIHYSGTGSIITPGISLPRLNGSPLAYGWYGVVQRDPTAKGIAPWPCRWMTGEATQGAALDMTLGSLLSHFYTHTNVGHVPVGAFFDRSHSEWRKVIAVILARCRGLEMPSIVKNHPFRNRIVPESRVFSFLSSDPEGILPSSDRVRIFNNLHHILFVDKNKNHAFNYLCREIYQIHNIHADDADNLIRTFLRISRGTQVIDNDISNANLYSQRKNGFPVLITSISSYSFNEERPRFD